MSGLYLRVEYKNGFLLCPGRGVGRRVYPRRRGVGVVFDWGASTVGRVPLGLGRRDIPATREGRWKMDAESPY